MLTILFLRGPQPELPLQHLPLHLAVDSFVCLSTYSGHSTSHSQAQSRSSQVHRRCSCETLLVLRSPCSVNSTSHFTSFPSRPAHAEPQPNLRSCNQFPAPHSVAAASLTKRKSGAQRLSSKLYSAVSSSPLG